MLNYSIGRQVPRREHYCLGYRPHVSRSGEVFRGILRSAIPVGCVCVNDLGPDVDTHRLHDRHV